MEAQVTLAKDGLSVLYYGFVSLVIALLVKVIVNAYGRLEFGRVLFSQFISVHSFNITKCGVVATNIFLALQIIFVNVTILPWGVSYKRDAILRYTVHRFT